MHLKGIRKDEKTYFLPYKVHDKTISLKIDVYFLGDALKSTHLYKGKTETRNNGFCNILKKIKIQVWLSGGLMS